MVLRPKNRAPSNTAWDVADWSDIVVDGTLSQAKEAGVGVVVSVHEPLHVKYAAELGEDFGEDVDRDELGNEPDARDLDGKPAAVAVALFDMLVEELDVLLEEFVLAKLRVDEFLPRAEVLSVVKPWEAILELLLRPVVVDAGAKNTVDLSSTMAEPSKEMISVPIVYPWPCEIVTRAEPDSVNTKPVALE